MLTPSPLFSPVPAPQAAPSYSINKCFRDLEHDYPSLFSSTLLEYVDIPTSTFGNLLDVPMDKIAILKVEPGKIALGTKGVASCIALCARGKTPSGESFLALCHKSSLSDAEITCFGIWDSLMEAGCSSDSIELFAVGGQFSEYHGKGSYYDEKEILELCDKYPLKGAHLHTCPEGDYGVEVVLTSEKVYYSKESLFDSIAEWDAPKEYSEMKEVFDYMGDSDSDY